MKSNKNVMYLNWIISLQYKGLKGSSATTEVFHYVILLFLHVCKLAIVNFLNLQLPV